MHLRRLLLLATFALTSLAAVSTPHAQTQPPPNQVMPDLNAPRPIDSRESVWLEELTWMEVRDLMKAGTTSVIIPTGGVEQNGPYLAAGKHNYVLQATCPAIARKLGHALCAPIVPFVPEGDIDPPTEHMKYPSTISVTQTTFRALLTDIASSLKAHGFERIILLGDSGGNQAGMKAVASELAAKWTGSKTAIRFIPEYYDYPGTYKWADQTFGWDEKVEGLHDDPIITTTMMTVNPDLVRIKERQAKGKASINGISLVPIDKAVAAGKRIVDHRADVTVAAINKAFASTSSTRQ
jgi:creatinine amidohydrolase